MTRRFAIGLLAASALWPLSARAANTTTANVPIIVTHIAPVITDSPAAPTVSSTVPVGTVVATSVITMTDGSAFTGTPTFADPDNAFTLVAVSPQTTPPSWNVVAGAGLVGVVPTGQAKITDIVSIVATQ